MKNNKRVFICFALLLAIVGIWAYMSAHHVLLNAEESTSPPTNEGILNGKSVVFVIPSKDFRDEELIDVRKGLESKGAKTVVASTISDSVAGMLGAKVKPDGLLKDIKVKNFDAVVFVGGTGSSELWDNKDAQKIAKQAAENKKVVAAICLAPMILAKAGLLNKCAATISPSLKAEFEKMKIKYSSKPVEVCGMFITASGPEAVAEFTKAIVSLLKESPKK